MAKTSGIQALTTAKTRTQMHANKHIDARHPNAQARLGHKSTATNKENRTRKYFSIKILDTRHIQR